VIKIPYIPTAVRRIFDPHLCEVSRKITKKGELEYAIFKLLKLYMTDKEYNYSNLHETVYAGIHAAEEFKRRYLDEREDLAKIREGDIN
jgi:hypothetical protein